ncbi:putative DNA-binding domain-containing protein [Pararobbsia alpina]|uniref:HvfC/BufC family peptide modification chaperone n=1 Tax=Pararobbsia alpina TaxID=621374 RepID=UPI0039A6A45D
MTLAELQQDFRVWLTGHASDVDGSSGGDAPGDANVEATWNAMAQRMRTRSASGFPVYQNNYRTQLVICLEITFPQVHAWLGDDNFLHAAVSHIDRHPPCAWTLDAYPEHFGETLKAVYPDNPDLHELAWIELALSDAFVAVDATPIALDALPSIDWDTARLGFVPSLRRRVATTNAYEVWHALAHDQTPPEAFMLEQTGGLVVWRDGFTSRLQQIDGLEFDAIQQVEAHGDFESLCEWLVARLGEEAGLQRAGALLAAWIGNGMVVQVEG